MNSGNLAGDRDLDRLADMLETKPNREGRDLVYRLYNGVARFTPGPQWTEFDAPHVPAWADLVDINWVGHNRQLRVKSDGTGTYSYRTYVSCDEVASGQAPAGTPCDSADSMGFAQLSLRFNDDSVSATALVTASNVPAYPKDSTVTISSQQRDRHGKADIVSVDNLSGEGDWVCNDAAPEVAPGSCGA